MKLNWRVIRIFVMVITFLICASLVVQAAQKVTLHLWDQFAAEPWLKKTIEEYNETQGKLDGVRIVADTMSDEDREFHQKMIAAKMAGTEPDMYNPNGYILGYMVADDMLSPPPPKYEAEIRKYYRPEAIELATINGQLWGYTNDFNLCMLFYYDSFFKEAGLDSKNPPTTWAQLREYAKKLTKFDGAGNKVRAGFLFTIGFDEGMMNRHMAMHLATGDEMFNEDYTECFANSEGGVKLTQFLVDMVNDNSTNVGWILWGDAWKARKGAMTILDAWFPIWTVRSIGPEVLEDYHDVRAAFVPTETGKNFVSYRRSFTMCVSKVSKHKEEAWKFIHWLHGPPNFRYLDFYAHVIGCIPPIKNFDELVGWHAWPEIGLDKINPYIRKTYLASIPISRPMPPLPDYEEIQDIMAIEEENALFGKKTAKQAIDDATKRINKILERRARLK